MSTIILGCDYNGVNDTGCQNTVKKILEKGGHSVTKLDIAPGPFASYSYSGKAKGKIGVYLMADSLVSVADLAFGGTQFKYAYFGIRGDVGRTRMDSWSDFNNNPIGRDADCTSICNKIAGKTYKQMNSICKSKCQITFGKNPTELGNNLLKLISGGSVDGDSKKKSTGGTIKEGIQKLLTHWDGQVECYVRGNKMYVNKVRTPDEYYSCVLKEGVNIIRESVSVTDFNPDTVNYLIVKWTGGTITFKNEKLIERFGEKKKEMTAVKKVIKEVEVEETDDEETEDTEDTEEE